ncbi:MAG TPA: helix-turn-helix domain-containing protein [Terracidiphilus sp.]|nr:helix-turn-helix domain-containing protein [Terracidiphilus sp.]
MLPEKFLYSQREAAESVALSRRSITHYIAKGDLETRRIGRRVLITRESLRKFASCNHFEPIRPPSKKLRKLEEIS